MMQGQGFQPQRQYEFSPAQSAVALKLATRMRLAAVAQLVFGAMDFFGSCQVQQSEGGGFSMSSSSSPFDVALIISAVFMLSAASSFAKIAKTQGWDMSHLMIALRSYSKATAAQFVTYIIMAIFFVLAVAMIALFLVLFASLLNSLTSGSK
jgi:hypothetical protein